MAEDHVWSASVGRWFGVPVRIHACLLLFIALIFGVEWHFQNVLNPTMQGTGLATVLVLIVSLIVHELAHLFAIGNLGGRCNSMLITPWGGNSDYALPNSGRARALIHLAGPFANGIVFLFGATILIRHYNVDLSELINPVRPHGFRASNWEYSLLEIATWINFQLMLINMLPCFPFDMAAAVRGFIDSLDVDLPRHRVEAAIMAMGHGLAFTMIGMAWLLRGYDGGGVQPAWFVLLVGGILLVFTARHSFARETAFDDLDWEDLENSTFDSMYEENEFFHFDETDENGSYSQWLLEKQNARRELDDQIEAEEERRADDILEKLHDSGIGGLSEEEKEILDRVSARLRRKRQQGV